MIGPGSDKKIHVLLKNINLMVNHTFKIKSKLCGSGGVSSPGDTGDPFDIGGQNGRNDWSVWLGRVVKVEWSRWSM